MDDTNSNNDSAISSGSSSSELFSELSIPSDGINLLSVKKRDRRQLSKSTVNSSAKISPAKIKKSISIDRQNSTTTTTLIVDTSDAVKEEQNKIKKERKQHVCHICDKQFRGSSDLKKHILIHTGEKPFKCIQCEKSYRQAIGLKNHIAAQHGTNERFTCNECSRSFPIKERLRLHMRLHNGEKPYKCPVKKCSKAFPRNGQLRQHLITHKNQFNSKKIVCSKCTEIFASTENLRDHLIKSHPGTVMLQTANKCGICEKKFRSPESLRYHLTCVHGGLKTFYCSACDKTLLVDIKEHIETAHETIRPFICDLCNAHFSQKSQLNVHYRMHSGERPYRCEVCWQAFAHSSVLKLHIRKHTGEKPFKCIQSECKSNDVGFSQLAHLKTHMRTIHKLNNSYQCDCGEFFKLKLALTIHQQTCELYGNINNSNYENNIEKEKIAEISKLRLLIAILLKNISTPERLKELGFEKRLIDNVIIAALKLANKNYYEDEQLDQLEKLKLNIKEFLEWTIPANFMTEFKEKKLSVVAILDEMRKIQLFDNS